MARVVVSPLHDADVPTSKGLPCGAMLDWEGEPMFLRISQDWKASLCLPVVIDDFCVR